MNLSTHHVVKNLVLHSITLNSVGLQAVSLWVSGGEIRGRKFT